MYLSVCAFGLAHLGEERGRVPAPSLMRLDVDHAEIRCIPSRRRDEFVPILGYDCLDLVGVGTLGSI